MYVEIDDHVVGQRRGPGRRPRLSHAELVCLAVAPDAAGARSERGWLRRVARELGHLFPYVPGPSRAITGG